MLLLQASMNLGVIAMKRYSAFHKALALLKPYWGTLFWLWFCLVSLFQRYINSPLLSNIKSKLLEWALGFWLTQSQSLSERSLQRYWRLFSLTWMSQSSTLSNYVIGTTQSSFLDFTIIRPLPHLSTKLSKLPHHVNYVQNIFVYLVNNTHD